MPTTLPALEIALLLVMPGFIATWVFDRFVLRAQKPDLDRVLTALTVSAVIAALWLIPFAVAFLRGSFLWLAVEVVLATLVPPVIMGYAAARISKSRRARERVSELLRLQLIDPTPSAWDEALGSGRSYWVIVHLKDGSHYAGVFGPRSFASNGFEGKDLYLEQLWLGGKDAGPFGRPLDRSAGAYFSGESIKSIEMFTV
jgi:hypothetical protein